MFSFKLLQAKQVILCLKHVLNSVNYTGRRTCRSCSINIIARTVHNSSTMDTSWMFLTYFSRSAVILWISIRTSFGWYYKYFDHVNPTICSPVANQNLSIVKLKMSNSQIETNPYTVSYLSTALKDTFWHLIFRYCKLNF